MSTIDNDDHVAPPSRWHRALTFKSILIALLAVLALLWLAPLITSFVATLDIEDFDHPYVWVFAFVVFDAIIPIFPSESLLTTGANLAAQDGSSIVLWRLALAGALGAILGDTLLYWLSRTVFRNYMSRKVDEAAKNPKLSTAIRVLHTNAPIVIAAGRFVPGLRFVVSASMGLTAYNYPKFLLWSAIGGTAWAGFNCIFSYAIASVVDDKPVVSIMLSVVVTTALLALLYQPLKQSWESADPEPTPGPA